MSAHDSGALDALKRKPVAMALRVGDVDHKPRVTEVEAWRRQIGHAIEQALRLAGLTKQDVSYQMGYGTNQAPLSNWIAGKETPQFAKLFSVPALRAPLVVALAALADDVEVSTTITVRRTG